MDIEEVGCIYVIAVGSHTSAQRWENEITKKKREIFPRKVIAFSNTWELKETHIEKKKDFCVKALNSSIRWMI